MHKDLEIMMSNPTEVTSDKVAIIPESSSSVNSLPSSPYRVYKKRWFILLVLCLLNLANATLWFSFAPVADFVESYYDINSNQVNWFSLVFMISSIPVGLVASWFLDTVGIRAGLILSAWLTFIGAVLRCLSGFDFISLDEKYTVALIGQTIAAIAQPFVMFAPAKVANVWFPSNQRATATTISSMSNPLGILVASLMSSLIVTNKDDVPLMLNVYVGLPTLVVIMATFGIWSSKPPMPPSGGGEDVDSPPYFTSLKLLFTNKAYIIVFFVFGAGMGLFSALSSLLEQMLCTRNYSDTFVGICGALMIGSGLLGAGLSGAYVDATKKFIESAKVLFGCAAISFFAFTVLAQFPDLEVPVAVSMALFGFFGLAQYAIVLELAVECSYPIAEATSVGYLVISGQVQSIILMFGGIALGKPYGKNKTACDALNGQPQDLSNALILCAVLAALAAVVFIPFFNTRYHRMEAEQEKADQLVTTDAYDNAVLGH